MKFAILKTGLNTDIYHLEYLSTLFTSVKEQPIPSLLTVPEWALSSAFLRIHT